MRIILFFLLIVSLSGCEPLALHGEVIDRDEKPIKGALIVNKRSGQLVFETHSDSAGRFFLDQMHLNDTLVVVAPGFQTEMAVYDYALTKSSCVTFLLKAEKKTSMP